MILWAWFGTGCDRPEPVKIAFVDYEGRTTTTPVTVEQQLQALRESHGAADARAAFSRGDYRLVAVQGITIWVPGLEIRADAMNRLGVKVVAGTSDMVIGETHSQLNEAARKYGLEFNSEMIVLMSTRGRGH